MKLYSVIKLSDGQEVFAKVEEDGAEGSPIIILHDPLIQEEVYHDDGSHTVNMIRYCMAAADQKVPLIKAHVVSLTAMSTAFKDYYKAAVEINNLSAEAYENKLIEMACKMFNHLELVERAKDNPVMFTLVDTDTIH